MQIYYTIQYAEHFVIVDIADNNIHKYDHYVIGLWEYEYTNTCTYECTRANGSSTGAYLNKIVEIGLSAAHADAPPTRCGQ